MNAKTHADPTSAYDITVLVLQGGGALGAYQAGAYQALAAENIDIDWIAGMSVGAINASIIAGNSPEKRLTSLKTFWETVTYDFNPLLSSSRSYYTRLFRNRSSALTSLMSGVYGFFRPRFPPPFFLPRGSNSAISFYDTSPLRETLEYFVDFDRVNNSDMRLSLGAVNVRTGNRIYFDNSECELRPEHVMASSALPPGLPAVNVDGEYYWDGGIASNTPLFYVLDEDPKENTVVFQVDLFSARGDVPQDIFEVEERKKDIGYSSRTRLNTDNFREKRKLKRAIIALRDCLPEELKQDPEIREVCKYGEGYENEVTIIHLIYKRKHYETQSKDYEFSRLSMQEHWRAGYENTLDTIRFPEWQTLPKNREGLRVFDMQQYIGQGSR